MSSAKDGQASELKAADITGPVLVLAPHADDESLGCGGLIAALCERGMEVHLWLVSDGTMSHPNSAAYPPDHRRAIREAEFRRACLLLGVSDEEKLHFFRQPDTKVPLPEMEGFEVLVEEMQEYFERIKPQTILTPWRRDPHCDHRATTALIRSIVSKTSWPGALYEYPIWLYELAAEGDAPHPGEARVFAFNLSEGFLLKKKKAIEAHASQLGQTIHDDPDAFSLKPQVLAHFLTPTEYYYHTQ